MQGQFYGESVPDQGSTFHFTSSFLLNKPAQTVPGLPHPLVPVLLPVAPGTRISAAHFLPPLETVPVLPPHLLNLPVLVVDDNASNRKALGTMLSSLKMQVSTAENGETAMDMFRAAVHNGKP
eukprot:TRINITY_DN5649_c0_g1_i1.p1 TRINITY_DN5649_c0_g1~~TRINITY_DN5649_c0_g1_i1.p1  ORF type:complete len:123 (+),score=31.37 TRINITY_DN5649_c0_g1_i1:51-419(+)